jgi:hypothetical protein
MDSGQLLERRAIPYPLSTINYPLLRRFRRPMVRMPGLQPDDDGFDSLREHSMVHSSV